MDFETLTLNYGIIWAGFLVGGIGGIIPLVNVELFLLFVTPMAPVTTLVYVALAAALGQMLAKYILYYGGENAFLVYRNQEIRKQKIVAMKERMANKHKNAMHIVFFSSITGLPPFYAISIAAGTLKLNLAQFMLLGMAGRSIRFVLLVLFADSLKHLLV